MGASTGKVRQRGRDRRNRRRQDQDTIAQIPFKTVRNPYPPVAILSDDQIEDIHRASLDLLRDVGMVVLDPPSRDHLRCLGADVDDEDGRVRFDPALIEETMTGLPGGYTAIARDPAKSIEVGGDAITFASVCGPSFVSDLDNGRRAGTYREMCDVVRLVQSLNILHFDGGAGFEPLDLPPESRHMDMMYAQITLTDKSWHPCWLNSGPRARDVFEMTRIGLGMDHDTLAATPTIMSGVNTNSPLVLDGAMAEGMIELARLGQPVCLTPFTLAGAMSPATLAATLVQQNAEFLLGAGLVQAVRRGVPVIYGHFATNVDMKTGAPAFGTPEYVKLTLATAQMARRYGCAFRSSNTTASKAVDGQAAYESGMSLWGCILAHTNLVLHAAGWLEGGLVCSFEKLILDAEMLQMMAETLVPIITSPDELGAAAFAEVDPGGHFLGAAHTLARYENAFYAPLLSDWDNFESWKERGSEDTAKRANGIWKSLLANYEPPALDPAIDEELRDYMAQRKEEIARTGA